MSDFCLSTKAHAWVYMNRVLEGPSRYFAALLADHSIDEIAHGVYHGESWIGALAQQTASRRDWLRQEEDLAIAAGVGARLITPADQEWPRAYFDRAFNFYAASGVDAPASFDREAVAPHSLWVRGRKLAESIPQAVAVVGTRAITRYGHEATTRIVSGLAQHHWSIVSGGALGIDTVAHEVAFDHGVPTVAVAACGIDQNYPARNRGLFDRIADNGCVISEFPPEATPQRHRFLTRNRLTAALTEGTVVIEAAFRSGALNTLNWAEALGRLAMAVPGPITSTGSLGCHQRIQQGRAQLVTSSEEIRELVGRFGEADPGAQYELEFAPSRTQALSRNELRVFDAVPPHGSDVQGLSAGDIARDTGLSVGLTVHVLVSLEGQALVSRNGRLWHRCAE